jgi:hypothetical protein
MPVVITLEYGTLAIEVGLVFIFAVVFLSTYLLAKYRQIIRRSELFGALPRFELGWR